MLLLYRSYPGETVLRDYLRQAIQAGLLSVAVFISTFLQAARSLELRNSLTLDLLCRLALDGHYSSGLPPRGSVVHFDESSITTLGTIQDALVLLRAAHTLPELNSHQLTLSASELVILLLSCVNDMSQISTAQAMVQYTDANDMLHTINLSHDVRQVLETFVLSLRCICSFGLQNGILIHLSLLIRDDEKAAREAEMMHTIQMALGKGDEMGHGSEKDTTSCSLLLHTLVCRRSLITRSC